MGGGFVPGLYGSSTNVVPPAGSTNQNFIGPLLNSAYFAIVPQLTAVQDLSFAAIYLGLAGTTITTVVGAADSSSGHAAQSTASGLGQTYTLQNDAYSLDAIPAKLHYVPAPDGKVELAWDYILRTPDGQHWYDASVDSSMGSLVELHDWVDHATYNVYPRPVENPDDGSRSVLTDPYDPAASPYGWQTINGAAGPVYTVTRGNNVNAYEDRNATDTPGYQPSGGSSLNFNFPLDLTKDPVSNQDAAITNLFYWNNLVHDIDYKYGFTEAAGNFQEVNYSGQGLGGDPVLAEAQDGEGTDNANFATPPDGQSPTMQMYLWDMTTPYRDGDFDSIIMVHEAHHGVSNRLVGGPADANALDAVQSGGMGEGWSDWWGLMYTRTAAITRTTQKTIGNYVEGLPPNGAGIRRYPYSFDMTVDPLTYGNITTNSEVHDEGEVWCSALWDMTVLLEERYGFDADIAKGYSKGRREISWPCNW